jgi:hypothetical protein
MITLKIQNLALKWFAENNIIAYAMGGNIYVSTGEYDVQITDADIKLRADLQKEEEDADLECFDNSSLGKFVNSL